MLTWAIKCHNIYLYTKNKQLEFIVAVTITYLGITNKNNNSFYVESGDGESGHNWMKEKKSKSSKKTLNTKSMCPNVLLAIKSYKTSKMLLVYK